MTTVPADFADLCGAPHFAHLVTVNPNGYPQSSPIWIIPGAVNADGSVASIRFSTGPGYRKTLNMLRDPRVSLSIHDVANPYRTLEIVGRANLEPRNGWSDVDEISQTYLGTDYPFKEGDGEGYRVNVEVVRAYTHGDFEPPASVALPEPGTDLLMPPHFAHVATVSRNGQPRSSVVWHRRVPDTATDIEFWTGPQTVKTMHLRNNSKAAVSVHDEANGYTYTEVRGDAEIIPVDNHQLLDELTPHYWQLDKYPAESDEPMSGVVIRVRVNKRVN